MKKYLYGGVVLVALIVFARSGEPYRDWPSVEVAPALDVPMRHTAITRGPDGAYYLTGTLGVPCDVSSVECRVEEKSAPSPDTRHPTPDTFYDFENSREIKLWRSKNLKQWKALGTVFDLRQDDPLLGWAKLFRVKLDDNEPDPYVWGVQAPELHYIKDNWWICFSVNGQGTGLLKSKTGKPEGPYQCHARITARGGHASMFVDDDPPSSGNSGAAGGTVYWLTDGGWIAPLTDDMKQLAEQPKPILPAPDPVYITGQKFRPRDDGMMSDHPKMVGERGAFMFKHNGRYFLTAADYNSRLGVPCDDTWIAYADHIDGPWSERHLMIPNGADITVFKGPDGSTVTKYKGPYDQASKTVIDGPQFYATFYGNDVRAMFRDRPSFLPLEWIHPERWDVYFFKHHESFPRKPQAVFTEKGPWKHLKPLDVPEDNMRDMHITMLPDKKYYLGGSVCSRPGELVLFRSDNLIDWEEMPVFWRYEDIEWLPKKLPPLDENTSRADRFSRIFWGAKPYYLEGDYYIIFGIFRSPDAPDNRGIGVLKSTSGKIEGPYVSLGKVGGQLGVDPGPLWPNFFEGLDGKLYAANTLNWKCQVAEVDLDTPGWKWDYKPVDQGGAIYATDGFGTMETILGHYVYVALRWGGPAANVHGSYPEAAKHYGTYDLHYQVCDTPWGPVHGPLRPITRVGAGNLFQDKKGYWWHVYFGNEHSGAWWQNVGLVPMTVKDLGDDLLIETDEDYDEYQLNIMGGGEIADVLTVVDTLE